ncbi:MAG: hypothetical protein IPH08_05520 [Rhodocyclaceae bacterium]|nr:hypothetical protein [Rhodocyclaceae bacterium]
MTMLTIADYLKLANLQLAAESLFTFGVQLDPDRKPGDLTDRNTLYRNGAVEFGVAASEQDPTTSNLTRGNERASRFTPTEVAFSGMDKNWTVVEHLSNTTTGFSGTLFQAIRSDPVNNVKAGEYVLSFRSTGIPRRPRPRQRRHQHFRGG